MTVLARKINRAKWDPADGFAPSEITADAVTADLRTIGNTLSFWTCTTPSEQELKETVLAIASAAERLDKFDITWVTEQEVLRRGLIIQATDGNTPVTSLRSRHVDIAKIDLVRLGTIAQMVANAIGDNRFKRITKREVLEIVTAAVLGQLVRLDELKDQVRREVSAATENARRKAGD